MKLKRTDFDILTQKDPNQPGMSGGGQSSPSGDKPELETEFEPDPSQGQPQGGGSGEDSDDSQESQGGSGSGDIIDQILDDITGGGKPIDQVMTAQEGAAHDPEQQANQGVTQAANNVPQGDSKISGSERDWTDSARNAIVKAGLGKGSMLVNAVYARLKPQQDWKKVLKDLIGKAVSEYKLIFGNRRFIHSGDYLYRVKQHTDGLSNGLVCIDVSGSISDAHLQMFLNETLAIMEAKKIKKVTVLFFDDGVQKVVPNVTKKDILKVSTNARGGTQFKPTFNWISQNQSKKFELILFFTDGYNSDGTIPKPDWAKYFWWVIVDNPAWSAPWGRRVDINTANLDNK